MRALARCGLGLIFLIVTLAVPASADDLARYAGKTSAPPYWNRVNASVVTDEDESRFVNTFFMRVTLICEDGSKDRWTIGFKRDRNLDDEGGFSYESRSTSIFLQISGTIRWARGSGTILLNVAELTEDGLNVQMCTTGDLTWSIQRMPSTSSEPFLRIPQGTEYLEVRGI